MKKIASYALGCKVNQYESEAIAELFAEKGYEVVSVDDEADVYIINTCTVTNFGDKKSRQLIRKVKRQNENAIVAVVGCYAQTAPEELAAVHGVNLVIGTKDKSKIVELVEDYQAEQGVQNYVTDIMHERVFEPLEIKKLANRTRAYLKIQDGCSQFCSYCIIPYARGPIRSRQPEDVIAEVKRLAENGFKEVVLTGIHVASYGKDLKTITLTDIIRQVHEVEGIERIRFSSIEPNVVTEEFAAAMAELPKVCDHFHLSLQSGCDKTLKEMNRKYDTEKYRQAAALLRKYLPDVAITTDIIVGFPGETEEEFQDTLELVKKVGYMQLFTFIYSKRTGTKAAEMPDPTPRAEKTDRMTRLLKVQDEIAMDLVRQQVGQTVRVLVEGYGRSDGTLSGRLDNNLTVEFAADPALMGSYAQVHLTGARATVLLGELET